MASLPQFPMDARMASSARVLQLDLSTIATVCPTAQRGAWQFLQTLLERACAMDCQRLYVEPDTQYWRLRYKTLDGLSEEIVHDPSELQWAMDTLHYRLWGDVESSPVRTHWFATSLKQSPFIVQLDVVTSTTGETHVFTLLPDPPLPARLDELAMTPAQALSVRTMLQQANGWVVLAGADSQARAVSLQAMAQEATAPDHRVLCFDQAVHPVLPRTTQIALEHHEASAREAIWDTALTLGYEKIMLACELPDFGSNALKSRAINQSLVVQSSAAQDAVGALEQLMAQGFAAEWLSQKLRGIVVQHRIRQLCEHCKCIASLDTEQLQWLDTQRTPIMRDAMAWMNDSNTHQFLHGEGCAHCDDKGYSKLSNLFDVIKICSDTRESLASGDVQRAKSIIAANQTFNSHAMTMARAGTISLSEAMRVAGQSTPAHY